MQSVLFSSKNQLFSNRSKSCDENISDQKFKEIHPNYVVK